LLSGIDQCDKAAIDHTNKSMRVLHFFKTYWPETFGGMERVIDTIARMTADHGVEHHILSINDNGENPQPYFHGQHLHKARRSFEVLSTDVSFEAFKQYRRLATDADVVHLHFPWPFMDIAHLAGGIAKPTVVTYHADALGNALVQSFYGLLMHRLLSRVDRIVATSPNYLDSSSVLRRYVNKTDVIPLGLDPQSYPKPSAETLAKWHTRFGDDFFLFVGVLRHYKGLGILLDAAKGMKQQVVIVGGGKREAEYRARKAECGLENVHFVGSIGDEDKMALLKLCTAFVLPSNKRSEAFGLSLAEAAMMGKPMISCEIGTGTSFVNRDGVTGIVLPPDDAGSLRRAMTTLGQDADLASAMGAAAAKHFHDKLHASNMGLRYHRLCRMVLGETAA